MTNQALTQNLKNLLSETYILMLKSQNYHWNVTGGNFHALHVMFQEHYENMFQAVDELAERIRAVGAVSPGTFKQFQSLSQIDSEAVQTKDREMIISLIEDHKRLVETAKKVVEEAQKDQDDATMDMAIERIQTHEKYIWMLQSSL